MANFLLPKSALKSYYQYNHYSSSTSAFVGIKNVPTCLPTAGLDLSGFGCPERGTFIRVIALYKRVKKTF